MPWTLLFRNMMGHPVRSTLTVLSVAVALALLCVLDATARGYTAAVDLAAQNRLVVMSQVSLFVPLPLSYQSKIQQVEGVKTTIPLHQQLINDPEFQQGEYTIKWLEEWLAKEESGA